MADLKKPVLGLPDGRIGNIVYRKVKGKVVMSVRPDKYNASYSLAAVSARNKFKSYSKFASFVNKIYPLNPFWMNSESPGSTIYRKILMVNKDRLSGEFLSPNNLIAPFTIWNPVKSAALIDNTLNITLSDGVFAPGTSEYHLRLALALIKPVNPGSVFVQFVSLNKPVESGIFDISFTIENYITSEFPDYKELIVYSCFTFTQDGQSKWFTHKGNSFPLNT
ncbi:MAG: hypothetical protein AB9882_10810 [Ignavibacteriaceae bacterium]